MRLHTLIIRPFAVAATLVLLSQSLSASLVAGWNFNNYNGSDTTIAADHGSGSISLSTSSDLGAPDGTTVNAVAGDAAGTSISLFKNNGRTVDLSFSMAGLSSAVLTLATMIDNNGHNNDTLSYSLNGGAFTDIFTAISPPTSFATATYNLPAAVNGVLAVKLRYTLNGSSGNHGTFLDNIQINAVPEAPASLFGAMIVAMIGSCYCGRTLWRRGTMVKSADVRSE
jgi:tRNA A37 threonylcarbamoyltransferase TsaD